MRKLFFFAAILCYMLAMQTANAQNPITTLEHAGTTTPYYGQNSLVDAYTASVKGDYLYLSPGYFTAPTAIAKGVKIIGAGHFPDSANVAKRTYILSGLTINAGADSLRLEGLYINGDINYAAASSINYVKVVRCRLGSANFQSNSATASKNYCSCEECYIGGINFSNFGINLQIKHCLFDSFIRTGSWYSSGSVIVNINGNALIEGNIFLTPSNYGDGSSALGNVNYSVFENNIIYSGLGSGTGNQILNNIFSVSSVDFGNNLNSNNYTGIAQSNIFVNQTGNKFDYTHDYHLKTPVTYLGTDGTQVGIYGGDSPFKEKGMPSNPQITSKSVDRKTDSNGNLKINFTVKAQDN